MKTKYQVTSWSKLNGDGKAGAWLFIGSPVIQYLAWAFAEPGFWRFALVVGSSVAFCGGFVLLLIGRTTHSQYDEV